MYIDIIDAENTGLAYIKALSEGDLSHATCFSKNSSVIKFCKKKSIAIVSSYPLGKNQADFKIVSHVSTQVLRLPHAKRLNTIIRLHTSDKGLSLAIKNECDWMGILFENPLVEDEQITDYDEELMNLLAQQISLDSIVQKLNSKAPFVLQKISELHSKSKVKVFLQAA